MDRSSRRTGRTGLEGQGEYMLSPSSETSLTISTIRMEMDVITTSYKSNKFEVVLD